MDGTTTRLIVSTLLLGAGAVLLWAALHVRRRANGAQPLAWRGLALLGVIVAAVGASTLLRTFFPLWSDAIVLAQGMVVGVLTALIVVEWPRNGAAAPRDRVAAEEREASR
jgi:hypothetical protein